VSPSRPPQLGSVVWAELEDPLRRELIQAGMRKARGRAYRNRQDEIHQRTKKIPQPRMKHR